MDNAQHSAEGLLRAARMGQDTVSFESHLALISHEELVDQLTSEQANRAFWINVYNAYSIILLALGPVDLLKGMVRLRHYSHRRIRIAGHLLSLNDIEHGMLRHSRIRWSMGYLNKPFPSKLERALRVLADPRIHFALNCGAVSCPPIAFYTREGLNNELDLATRNFLDSDAVFDPKSNLITLSPLFKWYVGDFGGRSGMLRFLERYQRIPPGTIPRIAYSTYDWTVT